MREMANPESKDYHGIIIMEGLRDQSILKHLRILGSKKGNEWTIYRVGIREEDLSQVIPIVQRNLLTDRDVPFYVHFYNDLELIVVFPLRIFHLKPDKTSWEAAVRYGRSLGIPLKELDFKPCQFSEETF